MENGTEKENRAMRRARAHRMLDDFLDSYEHFIDDSPTAEDRRDWAMTIVVEAVCVVASICDKQVLEDAYGLPASSDRAEALRSLNRRLMIPERLFAGIDRLGGASSFASARAELSALSEGDEPRLFGQLRRGDKVKFREQQAKLRMLEWDTYLEAIGVPGPERHSAIAQACAKEWDTVLRWHAQVVSVLGEAAVARGLLGAKQWAEYDFGYLGYDDWRAGVIEHGLAFRETQRKPG
jgi:hypothetical protein